MGRFRGFLIFGVLAMVTGCNSKSFMDHLAPETTKEAETTFDSLRHGKFDRIIPSLDPSIDRTHLRDTLQKMAGLVPPQDPVSVKKVGAYVVCDTRTGCDNRVTLEYQFPSKWLLLQMVVHRQGASSYISSIYVEPESESLEAANRFTLRGKTVAQYSVLGAAIGSIIIMLFALVACIRTPMLKRKWLWIILILLGVGKLGVNWTTGEVFYRIAYLSILPAGLGSTLYGPWMLYASIPLGSILFLIFRERFKRRGIEEPPLTTGVQPLL